MWTTRSVRLEDERGLRCGLDLDSQPATCKNVLRGWQSEAAFRVLFNALLAESPYSAFRWETPPVTMPTLSQPFEFVLLDSPGIARHPDPAAFAEQFAGAPETGIVVFPNLGGDAIMVVPRSRAVRLRALGGIRP